MEKKCTKIYNARAQLLFCSVNLLFSGVPIAVAVVVFLNSLLAWVWQAFQTEIWASCQFRLACCSVLQFTRTRASFLWKRILCVDFGYHGMMNLICHGITLAQSQRATKFWKNLYYPCVIFQATCGTVSAVSDCLSLFSLFRFGAGMATAGCLLVRFVYCMEIIHINSRTAAGIVNNIFVSIGFSTLSLLGYLIRDWRYLMLAVSLPGAPLLLCWW